VVLLLEALTKRRSEKSLRKETQIRRT